MSPAHVLEPTYRTLKRQLMEGRWPPGEKLEALRLADDFGVSMTPVRDCLNRLVGEQLVSLRPGEGYRVPRIGEKTLRDMLEVNAELLKLALMSKRDHPVDPQVDSRLDYADRVAAVFQSIASTSGNRVIAQTVGSIGDRIHAIRNNEPAVFPDAWEELEALQGIPTAETGRLLAAVQGYHRRTLAGVSRLVTLGAGRG